MNNIILATDGYKVEYHKMYPLKTELVVSNFTLLEIRERLKN